MCILCTFSPLCWVFLKSNTEFVNTFVVLEFLNQNAEPLGCGGQAYEHQETSGVFADVTFLIVILTSDILEVFLCTEG